MNMGGTYKILLLAGIAWPAPLLAQQGGGAANQPGISDIIVTAQRREERLQDVPVAVTALPPAALAQRGITSIQDFQQLSIPGLRVQPNAGQPATGLNLRGINTQDPSQFTLEQGVALYIDEVYFPRGQGLNGGIADIQSVQVLRGPQGTLFGRNAEGGAILVTTRKPTGEFGLSLEGTVASFGERTLTGHLNLPEFANISIKLDANYDHLDGTTINAPLAPGQNLSQHYDFGYKDNVNLRGSILWEPSTDFRVLLTVTHNDLKQTADYPNNGGTIPPTAGNPIDIVNYHFTRRSRIPLWVSPFRTKVDTQTLTLTYDASDYLTLKSITARSKLKTHGYLQLAGSPTSAYLTALAPVLGPTAVAAGGVVSEEVGQDKIFSQELQGSGTAGRFTYTVGAFYFRENAIDQRANYVSVAYYANAPLTPVPINPVNYDGRNGLPNTLARIRTVAYAVYGQLTYDLTDQLKVTLGGRYTEDQKDGVGLIAAGQRVNVANSQKISRADPSLTIAYQPTPELNFYARYAQAFRSGGITVRSPSFRAYGPEVNRQVEIGMKSELFDRRVIFNVAAYHSWVKGQQINVAANPQGNQQNIINTPGTTKIYGLEAETTVRLMQGLTLAGNLSLIHVDQPRIIGVAICPDGTFTCAVARQLKQQPTHAPPFSAGFSADYQAPLGDMGNYVAHIDWNFQNKYNASPFCYTYLPCNKSRLDLWNARTGLEEVPFGSSLRGSLYFTVNNLFNSHNLSMDTAAGFIEITRPRTYRLTAKVEF